MIRSGSLLLFGTLLLGAMAPAAEPDFKEVYDLIQANLPGASQNDLNAAAVKGFVSALAPKVVLLPTESDKNRFTGDHLTRTTNIDSIAYFGIGEVSPGIAEDIRQAFARMSQKQKPKGLVLDLRYAGGEDYPAAAETVDLFVQNERVLFDAGDGVVKSHSKQDAITVPVAVLINQQTKGAAEVVAAVMRETGSALLLGRPTAGQAMVWKDFPLKNGGRLRIATGRVEVGKNTELGPEGVAPDIAVNVSPAEEQLYYADPFRVISSSNRAPGALIAGMPPGLGTNSLRRPRNEAELVRDKREGIPDPESARARRVEPERPFVADPVLGRALDLLKGLAVVRRQS